MWGACLQEAIWCKANMSEVLEGGKKVVSIYGIVELKLKKDFIAPMGPVLYNSYSLYNSDSLYNSYSHEHTIKISLSQSRLTFMNLWHLLCQAPLGHKT